MNAASWTVDQTKILTKSEILMVLAELKRKGKRSVNTRQNLIVFRLATCCGLRVSEIAGLKMSNVKLGIAKPYILVPKAIAKGQRSRRVPLWWDRGTLDDMKVWKTERTEQKAVSGDYFVCSQGDGSFGNQLDRHNLRLRFIGACKILGERDVTIHDGRHTFISHALAGGRTLAEVKTAAGHASIATTSVYTHIAVDDDGTVGGLFE